MQHYINIVPCSQRNKESSCHFHLAEEAPKLHYFGAFNQNSSRWWVMWVCRERQCKHCWWRDRPLLSFLSLQLLKNVIKRYVFLFSGGKKVCRRKQSVCVSSWTFFWGNLAAECCRMAKILVLTRKWLRQAALKNHKRRQRRNEESDCWPSCC